MMQLEKDSVYRSDEELLKFTVIVNDILERANKFKG